MLILTAVDQWQCSQCTFINKTTTLVCTICGTQRTITSSKDQHSRQSIAPFGTTVAVANNEDIGGISMEEQRIKDEAIAKAQFDNIISNEDIFRLNISMKDRFAMHMGNC